MEQMVREIARLAQGIQDDIAELRNSGTDSNESDQSIDSSCRLARIEEKLDAVHDDTSKLVRRVPTDLGTTLNELKRSMLLRLDEASRSTGSADSGTATRANHSNQSVLSIVKSLTRQEQNVFRLCFQSGFLTYQEIASHLAITPSAAKNLVNRIFQSDRKRPLFAKQYDHGSARVGIQLRTERSILEAKDVRGSKQTGEEILARR